MERLIITKIEKQKRQASRYNIFINEEYAFSVHEDLLVKYRLLKGGEIDRDYMAQLLEDEERQQAYVTAIRFLSVRARSVKEVKSRLKKAGYEAELIDHVIGRLHAENYLDDAQFADMTADERLKVQKKGRLWIKYELKQKGISDNQISETMAGIDPETEEQEAQQLAEKKWGQMSGGDPVSRRRKLAQFLLRRGYPAGTVQNVLRRLQLETEELPFDSDE